MYNFLKDFFKENKFYYFIIFICKIRIVITTLILPHYYGLLISNLKNNNILNIKNIFIYLITFWILSQFFSCLQSYIEAYLEPKFLGFVRTKIIKNVINNYKNNYKDLEIGRFITKIINTPYLLIETFDRISRFITDNIFKIGSTFVYLTYYNTFIGIAFLVCMLLISFVTYIYVNKCKDIVYESQQKYDDLHEYIEDTISNLLSIYSANKNNEEIVKYKKKNKENEKLEVEIELCNIKFRVLYSIIFILFFVIINYLTIYLFIKSNIKLSILISIIIINYGLLGDLMYLLHNIKWIIDSIGRITVFNEYINNITNNIKLNNISKSDENNKIKYTHNIFKNNFVKLEIKNLNFKINDKYILKNINLNIDKKEKIVISGIIGSGKSTLTKLIFGLLNYNEGIIKINNIDKKNLDNDILKDYITYIPQHPKLFNRTLYDNLTYGLKDVSINNIYAILDELKLFELKKKYVDIMYNKTGKNGSNLSGGQRQIVWLLRSILKNNRMIILDEPTSSLDNNTKIKVLKLIKKLSEKKNVIIISHDKEVYKYMDRLIELKNGMIIKNKKLNN